MADQTARIIIEAQNKTAAALGEVNQSIKGLGEQSVVTGAKFAIGFEAATKAIEAFVKAGAEIAGFVAETVKQFEVMGARVEDMSSKLGVSAQAFQEWDFAAKLVGTTGEAVGTAVVRMSKNIAEGTKVTREMIHGLGLNFEELQGMNPAEQFRVIAEAIKGVAAPGEQASVAFHLMGRSAEVLKLIRSDFEGASEEAHQLGAVMSEENVRAAHALENATTKLDEAWKGLRNTAAAFLVDQLGLTEKFETAAKAVAALTKAFQENKDAAGLYLALLKEIASTGALGGLAGGLARDFEQMALASDALAKNLATAKFHLVEFKDLLKNLNSPTPGQAGGPLGFNMFGPDEQAGMDARQKANVAAAKKAAAEELKIWHEENAEVVAEINGRNRQAQKIYAEETAAALVEVEKRIAGEKKMTIFKYRELLQQKKDMEDIAADQNEQIARDFKDAEIRQQKMLSDIAALGAAMIGFGQTTGGAFGTILTMGGQALEMYAKMKQAVGALQVATVALGAATQAYSSGGFWSGAATGAGAGAAYGPWGALIGGIAGGLLGAAGAQAKLNEAMAKMNQSRKDFIDAAGGVDELRKKLGSAQWALDALLDVKRPQDFQKAMDNLNKALADANAKQAAWLQLQIDANKDLDAAMKKYGITIDQLGPKFRQQKMDEMALDLLKDFDLLNAAGVDWLTLIEKMGPDINKFVNQAIDAGTTIPEAWKPILQKMIDNHELLDKNGKAYGSLEEAGIHFAQSVTDAVHDLIQKITDLVNALLGIQPAIDTIHGPNYNPNIPTPGTPGSTTGGNNGGNNGGGYHPGGFYKPSGGVVLPFRGRGAGIAASSGGGGVVVEHNHFYIGGEKLDNVIVKRQRGGFFRR